MYSVCRAFQGHLRNEFFIPLASGLIQLFAAAIVAALLMAQPARAQRPYGIDVSSYQGSADSPPTTINWTSVKGSSSGAYAWAKATEGTGYIDADFTYNVTQAKSAGVPIGAYHFGHPDTHPGTSGADSEASYFWNEASPYIVAGGSYLMPMLDAEVASPGAKTAVSQWVNEWCNDIVNDGTSSGVVLKPIVYTINLGQHRISTTP